MAARELLDELADRGVELDVDMRVGVIQCVDGLRPEVASTTRRWIEGG